MSLFRLPFRCDEIDVWADRYDYPSDSRLIDVVGPRARERGYYDKGDFLELVEWKAHRVASRAARNSSAAIEETTRIALSTPVEELRIWAPQALTFVSWPIASVLLHFAHREPYPILDFRVIEALGTRKPAVYSMPFWLALVDFMRTASAACGVPMRRLDQALWQWSKERGAPADDDPGVDGRNGMG